MQVLAQTSTADRGELTAILRIALPLIAAYFAEFAMFLITKIIVGHIGYVQLAAVGIAADLTFEMLVVLMGLLSIIGVFAAEAEGAGRRHNAGQAVRQGMLVATLIGVPATIFVWHLDKILALTGQDPRVVEFAGEFLKGLSGCVLPILWFAVLRNFVSALSRTGSVMVITLAALVPSYGLTVALVHGAWIIPPLGLFGAGLAITIVNWAMLAALLMHTYLTPALRGYGVFKGKFRIDLPLCGDIFRLGIPVAGIVFLEAGMFIAVSIFSGIFGAKDLAAYELLMAWVGIPFVIALGLAEGTMVRVAHNIGQESAWRARRAGIVGMVSGVAVLALLTVVPIGVPDTIVSIFLREDDPGFEAVSSLAKQLLIIVAVFQVFDGLQAVASRALRGLKDTYVPLWLAGFGYWVLGIGGGLIMAFPMGMETYGLWLGLALGLIVSGLLLTHRFLRLSGRLLSLMADVN